MTTYTERDLYNAYEDGRSAGYEEGYRKALAVRDMELAVMRTEREQLMKYYSNWIALNTQPRVIVLEPK